MSNYSDDHPLTTDWLTENGFSSYKESFVRYLLPVEKYARRMYYDADDNILFLTSYAADGTTVFFPLSDAPTIGMVKRLLQEPTLQPDPDQRPPKPHTHLTS